MNVKEGVFSGRALALVWWAGHQQMELRRIFSASFEMQPGRLLGWLATTVVAGVFFGWALRNGARAIPPRVVLGAVALPLVLLVPFCLRAGYGWLPDIGGSLNVFLSSLGTSCSVVVGVAVAQLVPGFRNRGPTV